MTANADSSARARPVVLVPDANDPGLLTPAQTSLLTDQYELAMTASYLRRGMNELAVFELFIRHLPPRRRWLLAADGELTLAHVFTGDPHLYGDGGAMYEAAQREPALDLLEAAREKAGVQAHLRWRSSPSAGRGLHELCELIGADLLIVGSSP